jgi:hypothetical protein
MQTQNEIEMARFKQKAHGYRTAHQVAPSARAIEASAIVNCIEGYRLKKHLTKSELVIVDLMAGTGFVSKSLRQAGFKNIHALEACNEMSQETGGQHGSKQDEDFILHPFADIKAIGPLLRQIGPHVIVCLGGFHHLIEFEADKKTVNAEASITLQEQVIKTCVESVSDDGMFLLVDVYEDGFEKMSTTHWPYWHSGRAAQLLLDPSAVPVSVKNDLLASDSFQKFATITESQLSGGVRKTNPALHWFRRGVDELSTAGHKDIPITARLIDRISKDYKVSVAYAITPWVFSNKATLDNFVLTFWFDDLTQDTAKVAEILKRAEEVSGVHVNGTFASFGWNLSFIAIEAKTSDDQTIHRAAKGRMIALFIALILLGGSNFCLKLFSYWTEIYRALDAGISLVVGWLIGEAMAEWRRK